MMELSDREVELCRDQVLSGVAVLEYIGTNFPDDYTEEDEKLYQELKTLLWDTLGGPLGTGNTNDGVVIEES